MTSYRNARISEVPALVEMLADDELGAAREDTTEPLSESYYSAFAAIDADPNNEIIVAVDGETILAFLQLTFIPYLTYKGGWRALIESVRVRSENRGRGTGASLIEYALDRARRRPCQMVQLTTDKQRPDALAFYERLGFKATHEGLKLQL